MAVPAGQLANAKIKGLEIPLVRARTLQEGAYTALEAPDSYDVRYPRATAQEHCQARLSQHGDSSHIPIVKYKLRLAAGLRHPNQLGQVHLEGIFENRHSGRLGFFHRQYLKEKQTGQLYARLMAGLWF